MQMCRALQSPADMLLGVDVVSCFRLSLPRVLFEGLNLILRSKLEFSLGLDGGWGCNG